MHIRRMPALLAALLILALLSRGDRPVAGADYAAQPPFTPTLTATWTNDPTRLEVGYAAGEPVTVEWLLRPELALNPPEQIGTFTLCTCAPDSWYKPVSGRALILWSSDRRELARATVPWPYQSGLPLVTAP